MHSPAVTIVTPSFNQGRFVRATIESVLSQDYPNIEYIIMDGGSTDETASVASEYASRLTFISEPDRGHSHAINKGLRMARGEIVSWLNSDDIFLDGAVSKAVQALAADSSAAAVYGEGCRLNEQGDIIGRFPASEPFNLWKLVHLVDYILDQALYIRKRVLDEVGYLDEQLHYPLDWELLIRIGKRYPIRHIPEQMGCIREYPETKTSTAGRKRVREIARVLRKHTGMRYPPGLLVYTLEIYRRWWSAPVTGRWAARIRREAQGLYRDGWASTRLRYMLPPGQGVISIKGVAPGRQTLDVTCNGASAGTFDIAAGAFEITVEASGLANLEIRASRSFRPESSTGEPRRRLAYVLKRIEWSSGSGAGACQSANSAGRKLPKSPSPRRGPL